MEREYRPDGEQVTGGSETEQPGRELVYVPYEEALRALLDEVMSNYNRPAWAGRSETWYLYIRLQDKGSQLGITGHPEEAEMFENVATALGILGYNTNLPENRQYFLREDLRRDIEELGKSDEFKLPDQGRKLLQVVTSVLGIEYNPLQEEFKRSTVLSQPDIEPPTEEDYLNMTEKAIQWEIE